VLGPGHLGVLASLGYRRVPVFRRARVGDSIDLAVDPRRFHFFDPETGARLSADSAPALAATR